MDVSFWHSDESQGFDPIWVQKYKKLDLLVKNVEMTAFDKIQESEKCPLTWCFGKEICCYFVKLQLVTQCLCN